MRDVDLQIAVLLLLIFIISYMYNRNGMKTMSDKLFVCIILSNVFMIVLELTHILINGVNMSVFRTVNYWVNWVYMLSVGIPIICWILYFDYLLFKDVVGLKRRWIYYSAPFGVVVIMMIIQLFHPFVFHIDEFNYLHRDFGVYLLAPFYYAVAIVALSYMKKFKVSVDDRLTRALRMISFIPMSVALIQLMDENIVIFWAAWGIAIVIAYIYIVQDEMVRDSLTGLRTREYLTNRLEYKLKNIKKFTVMLLDLDKFKGINDTYGHYEGDRALIAVADALLLAVSSQDTVCRYGGDEFVLILESEDKKRGIQVRNRINDLLERYNEEGNHEYRINASVGHYYVNNPSKYNIYSLMTKVDRLMYEEKRNA